MNSPKETNSNLRPHGRWYGDACGTAFGLELLGERWSLLIVREMMFGPRRFTDLRANLPGISAKVLTERLVALEANGIVCRQTAPEPTPAQLYGLTDWGYRTEPIIQELGRWAAASPLHDPTLPLSPASFMLSLRTMLDREAARDVKATLLFAIGTARFTAELERGEMPVSRGEKDTPDLRFAAASAPPLAALFYADVLPAEAGVSIAGDPALGRAVLDLFRLPEKA
ncbi:HxlR family transcriptional regulator [Palleronia aestuarii]|uniref:HxlR family transcriptional regulator n=1 Tax=Palleronia aestuarii TaxID=568105 RepID=A0A2W7N0Y7_9RHOB|nr:winged helix-turn-helix transcriptional regulator [Palleronia aestuarii]PZX13740.1 HxlR family transcriptional regulator [Palleronia aestuarii]